MRLNFNPDSFNCKWGDVVISIFSFATSEILQNEIPRNEIIFIQPRAEGPMLAQSPSKHADILSATNDLWSQYAYQFAHEFCHWQINGTMTGEKKGIYWLEETICELASYFVLYHMKSQWCSICPSFPHYKVHVEDYFETTTSKVPVSPLPLEEYINHHSLALYWKEYHRDLFSSMARAMLHAFLENPRLWLLLPYFGDLKSYTSPRQWLLSLQDCVPDKLLRETNTLSRLILST